MAGRTRVQRLQETIKVEVSDILRREVKDPRIGFVSVTSVEATNDLRHVRIYVSILGDDDQRSQTMKALEKATGFVRTELGSRIRLRHTPELSFRYDDSIEHGAHINQLLRRVQASEPGKPDARGDENG